MISSLSNLLLDGDTLVVGAPFDDIGANVNQGSAYVFEVDPLAVAVAARGT